MDKICKYIDKELDELETKIDRGGKLSGAEIEYGDKLDTSRSHFSPMKLWKKAILRSTEVLHAVDVLRSV